MKKNKIVLFDIDYTLFNTASFKKSQLREHSVYRETSGVLNKLLETAVLGIFSEGGLNFQKAKLNKTDIRKYFKDPNIHIALNKTEDLRKVINKYSTARLFFVDDKLSILRAAKKISPKIFTIWIKRGPYAENQKDIKNFLPDAILNDLKEIVEIVKLN